MSTFEERKSALRKARALLEELATSDKGMGVPKNVGSRAHEILRHLPGPQDVVDVLSVVQEYANSMDQADFGQAFALGMSERARSDVLRAQDMNCWLVIGTSLFLTVAFSASAFFAATEGVAVAKVIWLGMGAVACGGFAALMAADWLRTGRRGVEADVERDLSFIQSSAWRRLARRLERNVSVSLNFGQFGQFDFFKGAHEMYKMQVSADHLRVSDIFMIDATSGAQSKRGSHDAAFESGYFALLSVLSDKERMEYEHPSKHVIETASKKLRLDSAVGMELQRQRYSPGRRLPLAEVVAWANLVRARVRELGIK